MPDSEYQEVTVTYQITRERTVQVRPPIYEGIVSLRLSEETDLDEEDFEIVDFEREGTLFLRDD
jgi:hypothetical protein